MCSMWRGMWQGARATAEVSQQTVGKALEIWMKTDGGQKRLILVTVPPGSIWTAAYKEMPQLWRSFEPRAGTSCHRWVRSTQTPEERKVLVDFQRIQVPYLSMVNRRWFFLTSVMNPRAFDNQCLTFPRSCTHIHLLMVVPLAVRKLGSLLRPTFDRWIYRKENQ